MNIFEGKLTARGLKIAIVVSRFNSFLSQKLLDGAIDCLKRHEADDKNIDIFWVPGSFEIPLTVKKVSSLGYDGIIALGVLIKGDTPHFDYIAAETTKGISQVSIETQIPVSFGVVTADNLEQAIERCGTKQGNKGFDAALSVIEMINLFREIK